MKRFAFVMNIPSPYRIHLLTEVWRQLKDRGVEMHVHFMAKGYKDRPKSWLNPKIDFPHTYWKDYGFGEFHLNPGLVRFVSKNPPDWLVCGASIDTFTGIVMMLTTKRAVKIAWLEGNAKQTGELGGLRGWIKRKVLSKCRYAYVPGVQGVKYVDLHRALTKAILPRCIIVPNLVDETRFLPRERYAPHEIECMRSRLGCGADERFCLVPSRLEPVKGVVEFLTLLTPQMLEGWRIVVAGEGSLKAQAERVLRERGISGRVLLNDYVPYEEMPKLYAASDLMLLPSLQDQNPLAVVEALHVGLPVAVSDQAGNVDEAVTEGKNGWVLPVMDKAAFAEKLKDVFATSKERLREMGAVSRTTNSQFWNTKEAIRRFIDETVG